MLAKHFGVNRNTIVRYLNKHGIPIRTDRLFLLDRISTPEEVRKLYWEDNLSLLEIARKYKVTSKEPIIHYMRHHQIPLRSQTDGLRNYVEKESLIRNIDAKTLEEIRKLHWEEGKTQREILKILGLNITPSHFNNIMKAHNIRRRSVRETHKLQNELGLDRKHTLNQKFFSSWSPEMAYVLGWIYSDGNIDNGDRIRIGTKDKYILQNIQGMMNSTHKLAINKRTGVYQLELTSTQMYKNLYKFGLHPNKSKTINFPKVPEKYLRHFVRGVFEGDGSVWINNKREYILCAFYSGSNKFLEGLNLALSKNTKLPTRNVRHRVMELGTCDELRYAGYSCYELFNYMYKDVPDYMVLKRKYEKFDNYFTPIVRKGLNLIKTLESISNGEEIVFLKDITDIYNNEVDKKTQLSYLEASKILRMLGYNDRGRNSIRGVYLRTNL